jgi:hypothetical protein
MKLIPLFLLLYCLTTLAAEAPKMHMLVLGGSGDPLGTNTTFDNSLEQMANYYQQKIEKSESGQLSIAFDGGHEHTDMLKSSKFPQAVSIKDFNKDTFREELARFEKMMAENKTIKRGDQLLVYIDSHGNKNDETSKTHDVAAEETTSNNSGVPTVVSLDELEQLKHAAAVNGIKLAIIDLSCFSGSTQYLADKNTCVISSTGKNHYAFSGGGFSRNFTGHIRSGISLESLFLTARSASTLPDFPLISTSEGELLKKQIYNSISPYLYYTASSGDLLVDELVNRARDSNYSCKENSSFENFIKLLNKMEINANIATDAASFETKESLIEFSDFKKALKEYKDLQDKLTERLKEMHIERFNKVEQVTPEYSFSWAELLNGDWEAWSATTQDKILNSEGKMKEEYIYCKSVIDKANEAKRKILQENPSFEKYKDVAKNYENYPEQTSDLAVKIASLEKKIFDRLYKKYKKENNQTNPCREFIL